MHTNGCLPNTIDQSRSKCSRTLEIYDLDFNGDYQRGFSFSKI